MLCYVMLCYIILYYIILYYIILYSLDCLGNKQMRQYLVGLGFCLVLLQLTKSHCQGLNPKTFFCSSPAHLILHPVTQNTSEESCNASEKKHSSRNIAPPQTS